MAWPLNRQALWIYTYITFPGLHLLYVFTSQIDIIKENKNIVRARRQYFMAKNKDFYGHILKENR